jgi:hypothetical protein
LTLPTIHLNGTNRETMLRDIEIACSAVVAAQRALAYTAPNARDYYVQANYPATFDNALREHVLRMKMLENILTELQEMAEGISKY